MLLYDNAHASNYDEIKTWYPVWYLEILDMNVLLKIYGKQFDELQGDITQAVDNNFIDYADARTISELERFLRIRYDGQRTLDERRRVIKSFFIGGGRIGQHEIREIVSVFSENMNTDVEFVPMSDAEASYVIITVDITDIENLSYSDITDALLRRLPAHLAFELRSLITAEYSIADYSVGVMIEEIEETYESED